MLKLSRAILAASLFTVLAVAPASSQVVFSTFGAGSTFGALSPAIVFSVGPSNPSENFDANSFVWSGSAATLSSVDFAGQTQNGDLGPVTVSLLHGTSIGTATLVESWTQSGAAASSDQIFSLTSLTDAALVHGDTYWFELSIAQAPPPNNYNWAWNLSSTTTGTVATYNGTSWTTTGSATDFAFDVKANAVGTLQSVTPEPATMSLMALGLVGIAGVRRRKRSR
jgi:hypothetical protein